MTQRQLELWMTPEGERRRSEGQCIPDRLEAPDGARMVLWLAADDSRLAVCRIRLFRRFLMDGGGWFRLPAGGVSACSCRPV